MVHVTSDHETDTDTSAVRAQWVWLGALLLGAVPPILGLTFWTTAPFVFKIALGTLGLGGVLGAALLAVRISGQMQSEIREKDRNARRMSELEAQTRNILETAGDGIITYDEGGKVRSFNKAAAEIFGYQSREVVGTKVWDLISGQTSDGMRLDTGEATILDQGSVVQGRRKDDSKIPLEPAISKVRTEQGLLYTLVVRDLSEQKKAEEDLQRHRMELEQSVHERTVELEQVNGKLKAKNERLEKTNEVLAAEVRDRKRAESELRRSEARYHALVQVAPDAILIHQGDQITFANPAALRLFEAQPDELEGLTLSELIHPESQPRVRDWLRTVLESRKRVPPVEVRVRRPGGAAQDVEAAAAAFKDGDDTALQLVLRDITERKRAEAELQESERRQRALARQLLEAQEAERRHLAGELHDETGQTLTAIKITLQAAKRVADPATNQLLDECIGLTDQTLKQVRNLSIDLRPAALDKLGLVPSLRGLLDRQAERTELVMHLDAEVSAARLAPDLETACYRVVQEALTNILRHAHAREVWVRVRAKPHELLLSVRDDGVGFDVARARDQGARGASLGLLGLQERVQLAGGRLEIHSTPGQGTELRVRVPLTATETEEPGAPSDEADSRAAG